MGVWIPSSSKPLIFWELGYLAAFYSISVSSTPSTTTTKKVNKFQLLHFQTSLRKREISFMTLGSGREVRDQEAAGTPMVQRCPF